MNLRDIKDKVCLKVFSSVSLKKWTIVVFEVCLFVLVLRDKKR